jgi:hypothetical protein
MNITDHGVWEPYQPAELPENAPVSALFARRVGDQADWYEYVNSGQHFAGDSVKLTLVDGAVAAATTDPTALFPAGARVLEVKDVSTVNPQQAFGRKLYNAGAQEFYDPPARAPMPDVNDLLARIQALEADKPQE